jgi:Zn-dependent metalloprotease
MRAIISLIIIITTSSLVQANIFKQAQIKVDNSDGAPVEIKFDATSEKLSVDLFLHSYREKFLLSPDITFRTLSVQRDEFGQVHHRISQSYKDIEIPEIQMLVHEKDGSVAHAHGKFIHDLNIDIIPIQSEKLALQSALKYVNASSYMWENQKNEAFIKQFLKDPHASFYPKGRLIITSGYQNMIRENMRLAYRFDIHTSDPFGGYYVDVDANNGEVLNVLPLIYPGDVQGEGKSLYNGMVNITVSDTIPESLSLSRWHTNSWNSL